MATAAVRPPTASVVTRTTSIATSAHPAATIRAHLAATALSCHPLAVSVLAASGWLTALAATFMIDHFDLFGLSQVAHLLRAKPQGEKGFREVFAYRLIRHPLLLGFLIAFWATPTMTAGHLLFAVTMTAYIFVAIPIEEHDLVDALGEPYRRYRERVPALLPGLPRRNGRFHEKG